MYGKQVLKLMFLVLLTYSLCVSTTNMGVYLCILASREGKPELTKKCQF